MDRKPLTNHAGIMGVARGAKRTGHLSSEIKSLEKRMRRSEHVLYLLFLQVL